MFGSPMTFGLIVVVVLSSLSENLRGNQLGEEIQQLVDCAEKTVV